MELHPGTSITPNELKNIKCRQKWNAVRKAYARFVGKPYVIPPVYENKTLKQKENQETTNKTQVKRNNPNNRRNNTRNNKYNRYNQNNKGSNKNNITQKYN